MQLHFNVFFLERDTIFTNIVNRINIIVHIE